MYFTIIVVISRNKLVARWEALVQGMSESQCLSHGGGGEATDSGTKGQLRSDSSNWLPRLHTWLVPRLPTRTNEDEDESQLRDVEEGEGH